MDGDLQGRPDEGFSEGHVSPLEDADSWDAALARLEDVLLAAPFDRALPDLGELLRDAKVSMAFLQHDERALKLLREAVLARPLSSPDEVSRATTHVEMMTLEVEVLTERLHDPGTPRDVAERAAVRLSEIRRDLQRLRDDL